MIKGERIDAHVDDETKKLLDALAALYRSNRSHVVRLAVAELARTHGIPVGSVVRPAASGLPREDAV